MKKFFSFCLFFSCFTAYSQKQINLKDVKHFVGDTVMVCGKISEGKFQNDSKDSLTFLTVTGAFTTQQLVLRIGAAVRRTYKDAPETAMKGKTFCIMGRIRLIDEKYQIIIYSQDQIIEAMGG